MNCKLCESNMIHIEYSGKIKMNLVPPLVCTEEDVDVYQCNECEVIWHDYNVSKDYYNSEEYRKNIDANTDIESHYLHYDKNVVNKLNWTGTDIFRHKVVADIGCAGGCFLDFLAGVADTTIGVEPSEIFKKNLIEKGHKTYSYTENTFIDYKNKVDVITSFDVIEHVGNPRQWVKELYEMLSDGGKIIVGTPTDYPLLRKLIGKEFEKFIFQIHHSWIFSEKSLFNLFIDCGFTNINIQQKYHYGIGNVINWLKNGTAKGDIKFDYFSETLNEVWRNEMVAKGLGEYLLVTASKGV